MIAMADSTSDNSMRKTRLVAIGLIVAACWAVSVLSFFIHWGAVPTGAGDLIFYPLMVGVFVLPISFGKLILVLLGPSGFSASLALIGGLAFWPCNITFVVRAVRTGQIRYFLFFGVLSLLGSIYWHYICMAAAGV